MVLRCLLRSSTEYSTGYDDRRSLGRKTCFQIDDYTPTAEEGVRQFTLWVTEGFGKSIDKLIASTDFYKSRVDFCRNAIVDFTHRTTHLFMAQDAAASEDKDSVKSSYVFMEQQYLLPINEIPDSWSGFQKTVKADLKDWLN